MDKEEKWMRIHGILKTMIHTALGGALASACYVLQHNNLEIVQKKSELKDQYLKRLWAAWDIGIDNWEREIRSDFKSRHLYQTIIKFRNVMFTIADNDGAYLKLIYQWIHAWEKVKSDNKYLEGD